MILDDWIGNIASHGYGDSILRRFGYLKPKICILKVSRDLSVHSY